MSSVSSVSSALSSALSSTTGSSSDTFVSEDTFLQLLVTQLQNQDPLNPQDSSQFVSQLASFSTLEQMTQMSQSMESMLETSVTSLIGKTATVLDSTVSAGYVTGTITGITYYADGPAVTINSTDYAFNQVQNITS